MRLVLIESETPCRWTEVNPQVLLSTVRQCMESVQTQLTDDNGDVSEVKGLAEIRTYMHSLMVGSYICSYRYHKSARDYNRMGFTDRRSSS